MTGRLTGTVAEFDPHAGFGTVVAGDGRAFWFHCTAVVDGSRTIDVGTVVCFDVVAGHLGRWEAANVEPRGAVPSQTTTGPDGRP